MRYEPNALIDYLDARRDWAFGYGPEPKTHDCARFCGAGVKAVYGVDPIAAFSSSWSTRRGARRVLAAHGGMAAAVSEVMTEIDVTMAKRGDVGMLENEQLVLFTGEDLVGLADTIGHLPLPRSLAVRAWTV